MERSWSYVGLRGRDLVEILPRATADETERSPASESPPHRFNCSTLPLKVRGLGGCNLL